MGNRIYGKRYANGGTIGDDWGSESSTGRNAGADSRPAVNVSSDPQYDRADEGGSSSSSAPAPAPAPSVDTSDYGSDSGRGAAGTSETTKADAPAPAPRTNKTKAQATPSSTARRDSSPPAKSSDDEVPAPAPAPAPSYDRNRPETKPVTSMAQRDTEALSDARSTPVGRGVQAVGSAVMRGLRGLKDVATSGPGLTQAEKDRASRTQAEANARSGKKYADGGMVGGPKHYGKKK